MHQYDPGMDLRPGSQHHADPQRRGVSGCIRRSGRFGGTERGRQRSRLRRRRAEPPPPPPSGAASAAPSAAASGGIGNGTIIKLVAQQIEFDQTTLSAPAGTPFNIEFLNDDAGVPHDVWIKDSTGAAVFKGDVFPGVATKNYAVPALTAGQYTFYCTVHSNMTGTLTAG